MITMNELVDFRMQQHIAQEIYRQQIMQRIPDPFSSMLPMGMPHQVLMPPRPTLPGVEAKLENDELWKQFHKIGTEMIITKTGRRMFPSMRLSLSGLEEETNYCVLLEMVPIGDCRYKFSGTQWVPAGGAEPQSPQRMYLHPDSPATGAHWQTQPILFSKAKLTNNTLDNNGHIVLASMHKYQPRLHVIRTSDLTQIPWAPQQAFVFPETEFVAVTAYQNDRITKLKIDHNPFAKGFRETGQSRCKRKMSTSPTLDDRSEPPISKANSDDDRTSANSYDVPQIKRMRSNESANSVTSLEEGTRNVGGPCLESSNTAPHTLTEDINACALRYINAMEANLRSPLVDFSRSYYPQHLQQPLAYHQPATMVGQNLFPPQIDYARHNFPYPRLEQEPPFADNSDHKDDDNDSQSSAQSDEQCTDTFVDVVSTTEDHQQHQQPVDGALECETPVAVVAKRNSFTISAILGGRNVVAV